MKAVEEISRPFEIDLDVVSHDAEVAFDDIVGAKVTIALFHEGEEQRCFNGIVSTFSQGGSYDSSLGELHLYRLKVVPWLWKLTLGSDCRVFEDLSHKDVIQDVFDRVGEGGEFSLDLTATYSVRPYCVQYRERDFEFVSRLMEQEGIGYCFEHESGAHKLVAFDDSGSRPDCSANELIYTSQPGSDRDQNEIGDWIVRQEIAPGGFAMSGYDFVTPGDDNPAAAKSKLKIGGNGSREIFDYPSFYTSIDGDRYAEARMEEFETASYRIESQSACMPLVAGSFFSLAGHHRESYNARYLLTRVEHTVTQSVGTDQSDSTYSNKFQCIPDTIKYRPPIQTPRPRIQGSQTALVVGPSGEEIHCDEYGRVRIQFPWDRHGEGDGTNVCWARTSQSLAGPKFGAVFTPRISQEVVVSFIEGDPDRPLITGVVYNGDNGVPYALPDNKTQSGFKTRSTTGGKPDNYNEIRFEDKLGNEMFTIQAEKDLARLVKNDETDEVGNDRVRQVGNNEEVSIGHDRTVSVGNSHSESVSENETLDVGKDRTRNVGENETVSITNEQSLSIGKKRTIDVGDNQSLTVAKDHEESVGGKHTIEVAEDYALSAKTVTIQAEKEITIKVGKAKISMKKNGDISISGGKINVKGSKDVILKGSKVTAN